MMHRLEDFLSSAVPHAALSALKRSRLLTAAAWKVLRFYQDVTGAAPNLVRQLEGVGPAPPPGDGRRILVFSVRGWTTHLAWETTIARALHLRGARTLTVVCDKVLPACEPRVVTNDFASTCDRCMRQSSRILDRTGLEYQWLSAHLEPGVREEARRAVDGLSLPELEQLEREGVPLGRLVGASVNRHLMRGDDDSGPEYEATYRRFVAAAIVVQRAATALLDDFRPDAVLLLNGLFYAEAVLSLLARERDVPVWAYERGKKVDSLVFARNEPVVRKDLDEAWERRRSQALSPARIEALDAYLDERFRGNVGVERLWPEQTEVVEAAEARPTATLFTNVLWDTAVYDSDITFDSMSEWVLHTVEWFRERPELRLVVRVHPAEVRVPFKRSRDPVAERIREGVGEPPENVRIVGPGETVNSYGLLDRSDIVLVYASTIGLEAALKGVPTVVAGRTHYRDRGFTLDPASPGAYEEAVLRAFEKGSLSPDERRLARRYAYLYFFEEIVPFGLVREAPRSYPTLLYRGNEELEPGRDASLDAICESLLEDAPLTNPHA